MMRASLVKPILALLAALLSTDLAMAQAADPLQLPVASRQGPRWDLYAALGLPGQAANYYYADPTTGVRVTKVTSATWPLASTPNVFVDYSEGGPHISGEWTVTQGTTRHTILIRPQNQRPFLVDFQRGVGTTTSWQFPETGRFPRSDLTSSFSNVAATARILFFVDNDAAGHARLYRFNTETRELEGDGGQMPPVGNGHIPAEGREIMGLNEDDIPVPLINGRLHWMQSSKGDEWFVFMWCPAGPTCVPTKVFAFNRLTDALLERRCDHPDPAKNTFQCRPSSPPYAESDLNEPHLDRDGGYVQLLDGTKPISGLPSTGSCDPGGSGREYDETHWHFWDLATNPATLPCKGSIRPAEGIYTGHPAWVRGYYVSADPNFTPHWNHYYDRANDSVTNTVTYSHDRAFLPSHHAGQWIQAVADTSQWYWGSSFNDGEAIPYTIAPNPFPQCPQGPNDGWQPYSGEIYRTRVDWTPMYEKPAIGIRTVYQTLTDDPTTPGVDPDPNRLGHNLTQVGTLAAMTAPGTFFYDNGGDDTCPDNDLLYVWAIGGGNPTAGGVHFSAPTPVHRGLGVRRVNGTDVRLLAHNYAWPDALEEVPLATTSPDGKLVMFHSNMGRRTGRTDVFIAEVPLATGGGGGGCGGSSTMGPPFEC